MFNAVLMLSDRAPGVMQSIFGDFAVRMSQRLDQSGQVDALADGRRPGNDAIVHIGVWAFAMLLVGLALWRWGLLILGAILLFAASVFIEIGQGRYSSTRAVEMSDVAANGLGVAIGAAGAAGCYLVLSALATAVSPLTRHR